MPRSNPLKADLKTTWRLFGPSIGAKGVVYVTALIVLSGATDGIGLSLLIPLLNALGTGQPAFSGMASHLTQFLPGTLTGLLLIFVAVAALRAIVEQIREVTVARLRRDAIVALQVRVYSAIANASWSYLRRRRAADLHAVLSLEIERVDHGFHLLVEIPARAAIVLAYLILALAIAPGFSALAIACGLGLAWAMRHQLDRSQVIGETISRANTRVSREITEFLQALKLTKSYGAETQHIRAFAGAVSEAEGAIFTGDRLLSRSRLVTEVATAVGLGLFLWLGSDWIGLPLASLLVLIFVFQRLMPMFQDLYSLAQQLAQYRPSLHSVATTIDACEAAADRAIESIPAKDVVFDKALHFDSVSFRHDGAVTDVLRGIDVTLPAGSLTVVSGVSGAGKSTLLDLAGGLSQPIDGRILVDGVELTAERTPSWRRSVGYMAQEAFLFHDTIRANMVWADPAASDETILDAVRRVGLFELIQRLPKGLDTVVGDRGADLSGGERQRLALARTLLRKPRLILLDEPGSALDEDNAARVLETISALRGTTTILLVTHRPEVVAGADRYLVLKDGKLEDARQ